jgi:hypothetical protein
MNNRPATEGSYRGRLYAYNRSATEGSAHTIRPTTIGSDP